MEKKSNGKVIFITALISVISTLVLVVGIFFAVKTVSSVNSLDGYYETDAFTYITHIEIKGNEIDVVWNGDEYVGDLNPKTKTIEFDGKKLKYQVKAGKLVIENDDKDSDTKDVIFKKIDKEELEREKKKQE
jgi:ABC-type lipoprotein release transport system permease subunit